MGRRYVPPDEPWCLIGHVAWGIVQCIKVPESNAHRYKRYGWSVLIRDSEMPDPPHAGIDFTLQTGQNRRMWLDEEDVRRELDDDSA